MVALAVLKYFLLGSFLGLTAGISPGPLITLVLAETLKYGRSAGIKIAISPLITDIPIIFSSLYIFSQLAQFNTVLGIISLAGGVFITYLGYETIKAKGLTPVNQDITSQSLRKGIMANFLSPYPYLFWVTIGTPLIIKAYDTSLIAVMSFLLSFYLLMVGSKIAVAIIVARSKSFIGQNSYRWIMKILGVILVIFALFIIHDGLKSIVK